MTARTRAARGQAGDAAVELVAGLGLLLAPFVALAVTVPSWAEARYAVEAAAVEAGRLAAAQGDAAAADALATQILANHGIDSGVTVDVRVPTDDHGRPARHGEVSAHVSVTVPAIELPAVGPVGGWPLTRVHREPLDPWRGIRGDD